MYQAYVKALSSAVPEDSVQENKREGVQVRDPDVKETVEKIWNVIEKQCEAGTTEGRAKQQMTHSVTSSGGKIVRVFVSSTFADFFNEREVLVKKVFPELREWCKAQNLKLIECDLRWGVPKDTPTAETIMICLEEIDKCMDANDGQPFFVTLLGDRYGWIPDEKDVPSEAKNNYNWVSGTSITFMEILHGALRTKNPNAGFFMRDSTVYNNIPDSKRHRFVDEDPVNKQQTKVLKEKLKTIFPSQVFHYQTFYKQLMDCLGKERVELTGFEEFAKSVLDFLKDSISKMYPDQTSKVLNPFEKEKEAHWHHVLDEANVLIGRRREKDILLRYLCAGEHDELEKTVESKGSIRDLSDWDIAEDDTPVCVLEAPGGWGKTTLICSVIKEVVQSGMKVFYHIVGSTSSSNQEEFLLKRLLAFINSSDDEAEENNDNETHLVLKEKLKKSLSEYREKSSEMLLILIDGLNELSNCDTVGHLSWLPPFLPKQIRCIVSTKQHLPTLARLYEHPSLKLSLTLLTSQELTDIAVQYLFTYSKRLDANQLDSLITMTKVNNPLWVTLMAEELRIFGDFSLIDKRISEFPQSMDELLIQIIDRLVTEDKDQGLVKKVLCLIACSIHGLPSEMARQICGNIKEKEEVPQLYWLHIQRTLQPYLRMSGFLGETIKFSHEAVEEAVYKHLLSSESEIQSWHTVFADFYQYWCEDGWMRAYHLPKHLKRARLHHRLIQFMREDKASHTYISPWHRTNLLAVARCRFSAEPVHMGTAPMMLCYMCANRIGSFSAGCPWRNKQCCAICGTLCQGRQTVEARACAMHSYRRGRDMVKCVLCNNNVSIKNKSPPLIPVPAILCTHCAFGFNDKICAHLQS